jgi:hypothetical protein
MSKIITTIMNALTCGKYSRVIDASKTFMHDSSQLLDFLDTSIHTILYQGQGLVGVYANAQTLIPQYKQNIRRLGDDLNDLERVIRSNHKQQPRPSSYPYNSHRQNDSLENMTNSTTNTVSQNTHFPQQPIYIPQYNHHIASKEMKDEIISLYMNSIMTLKEASSYLEKKYGMHISSGTVSRRAREEIHKKYIVNVQNRREARAYAQILANKVV